MLLHKTSTGSLNLLSDAANHIVSSGPNLNSGLSQRGSNDHQREAQQFQGLLHDTQPGRTDYPSPGHAGLLEDSNLFFDDLGASNYFLPSSVFDSEMPISLWSWPELLRENVGGHMEPQNRHRPQEQPQDDLNPFSRFGSRLPSLQPEDHEAPKGIPKRPDVSTMAPRWKISDQDYRDIQIKLEDFSPALPKGFALPSRYALSRFIEGYVNGFHEHLPVLHIPTMAPAKYAPELLLAIVAVGAQYRFECNQANNLWYAAKSIAVEQTRRRHNLQVVEILSSPSLRSESVAMFRVSPDYCNERQIYSAASSAPADNSEAIQNDPR
jgi:hypothetical protein